MTHRYIKTSLAITVLLAIGGAFYLQSNRQSLGDNVENNAAKTSATVPVLDGTRADSSEAAKSESSLVVTPSQQSRPIASRYNTSTGDSLSNLASSLVSSKDIADVEYALYALQTRCVSFGTSVDNARQWLQEQPPLRFAGKAIGNDAERLVAIEKLHKKCAEISSNSAFDAQIQVARVRLKTERTPTQQFIGVTRGIAAGTASQTDFKVAMGNILSEPALGYIAGFSDRFTDYVRIDSVLRQQTELTSDDSFLVRKALLDMVLCHLGEDCSPNGLHFLSSCAKYGACSGVDVSDAYLTLYAKAGLDRGAFSELVLSTVSDIKQGGENLIANALLVRR
jgi:hypothetical protein